MIVAKFDDLLLARQLEETLLEAGFSKQEVFMTIGNEDHIPSKLQVRMPLEAASICYLSVQTRTQVDEDLANAVFRDLGVRGRSVHESKSSRNSSLTLYKPTDVTHSLSK
jgi:hypothetical protein